MFILKLFTSLSLCLRFPRSLCFRVLLENVKKFAFTLREDVLSLEFFTLVC